MNEFNLVGQTLGGRYRIEELIGQGGMSVVYRAFDPNLQRVVAVKIIKAHLASDPKFVSRFESEATAVAQLRHNHIVQVFDYSHDGDLYYMVQEFVPGETLQLRLRRLYKANRQISIADAIRYTTNVCDAVGYAHRRGLIHRDIKPSNIILDVQDQAILMDFGIVKILGGVEHTVAGAVVGTALYMPPEMIRGEVADARSDIYSLGVTMYEMLSGHPPFEADSAMTLLMMHLQDPVPDLRTVRPDIPEPLRAIVEKALAKDRNERYSSMGELQSALSRLQDAMRSGISLAGSPAAIDEPTESERTALEPQPQTSTPTSMDKRAVRAVQAAAAVQAQQRAEVEPLQGGANGAVPVLLPTEPGARSTALRRPRLLTRWPIWAGTAALLLALIAGAILLTRGGADNNKIVDDAPSTLPEAGGGVLGAAQSTPDATAGASDSTAASTMDPAMSMGEATPLPSGARVTINNIVMDEEQRYVASYQTVGLTEPLTTTHLHFFFNTVPVEQAGAPGTGPRVRYYGTSPFTEYAAADRPASATQLCALVANADHTVQPGSGNCATLPDVVALTTAQDLRCFFGPGVTYPTVANLKAGQVALVQGLSNDELWWQIANPEGRPDACWVSTITTKVTGDQSKVPPADPPPADATPQLPLATITQIISDTGQYVVNFETQAFTPEYPGGTHMHFYFNTFREDQVGIGGEANRRSHGGPPPFVNYAVADRPTGATQMCVVVANPDHSVIPHSGNCFNLPGLPRVQLTNVTVDAEERYVVEFTIKDFSPQYPGGTHLHFFFNTFTPEQVGIGGEANRRSHGGPSPFTAFTVADRPAGATEMCAVVANPDHSVQPNSENCFPLPEVTQ